MTDGMATVGQIYPHASQGHCWATAVTQLGLKKPLISLHMSPCFRKIQPQPVAH